MIIESKKQSHIYLHSCNSKRLVFFFPCGTKYALHNNDGMHVWTGGKQILWMI